MSRHALLRTNMMIAPKQHLTEWARTTRNLEPMSYCNYWYSMCVCVCACVSIVSNHCWPEPAACKHKQSTWNGHMWLLVVAYVIFLSANCWMFWVLTMKWEWESMSSVSKSIMPPDNQGCFMETPTETQEPTKRKLLQTQIIQKDSKSSFAQKHWDCAQIHHAPALQRNSQVMTRQNQINTPQPVTYNADMYANDLANTRSFPLFICGHLIEAGSSSSRN